ncbi:hypothetical protein BJX63DRAFT_421930 [Aspergillus granulosus]|uniref:Uncharacterized protein n=1 Tax=Aspergillus granulosus TaxID=176169 RepID=A0ABR4H9Q3_9EURO
MPNVPEFGSLPFDHYVIAKWDSTSPLSKSEQKRALVEQWVKLGHYGRREYVDQPPIKQEIPPDVPRDLLTEHDRVLDKRPEQTLWIRTWFGDKDSKASQEAADAGYAKVYRHAVQGDIDTAENQSNGLMGEVLMFTDRHEFGRGFRSEASSSGLDPDIRDGIALGTPGSLPWYVLRAMMHCPDHVVTWSQRHLQDPEEELDKYQKVLVVVVDRKACEDGWVLMFALNHKGAILPLRARNKAYWVDMTVIGWISDCTPLNEMGEDSDDEQEMYMAEGDGWDYTPDTAEHL